MLIQRDLQQATHRAPCGTSLEMCSRPFILPRANVLEFSRREAGAIPLRAGAQRGCASPLPRLEGGELLRERWEVLDRSRQIAA
jgi:hypothetical protein